MPPLPLVNKEPKPSWCELHQQWECYWIEGIGETVGVKDLSVGTCHNKASEQEPWCSEHKL